MMSICQVDHPIFTWDPITPLGHNDADYVT